MNGVYKGGEYLVILNNYLLGVGTVDCGAISVFSSTAL